MSMKFFRTTAKYDSIKDLITSISTRSLSLGGTSVCCIVSGTGGSWTTEGGPPEECGFALIGVLPPRKMKFMIPPVPSFWLLIKSLSAPSAL
eukprot:CAMPEP_0198117672 /NCGR_PEP_ID=MMETSP1442-20131203/18904_1 /TAXON_ID= /ORGANISM="Craspedostauros australis, Strain CCMP3328" /LENGTH=91 /DNA_ID=CAMNT_0043775771 /DNA_START=175 /DNA_END=450 /DNA_ORIENTATION=+